MQHHILLPRIIIIASNAHVCDGGSGRTNTNLNDDREKSQDDGKRYLAGHALYSLTFKVRKYFNSHNKCVMRANSLNLR